MDYFEKLKEEYKDNTVALKHIEDFQYYNNRSREGNKNSDLVCGYCLAICVLILLPIQRHSSLECSLVG